MTTHADLVRMAEEAAEIWDEPWSFSKRDRTKAHIATWHPARALAALAVIEAADEIAAGFVDAPDPLPEVVEKRLWPALAAWKALNDPEGSDDART